MNSERATALLLSGSKLTNKVRKFAMRCRETAMRSATPIYAEKVKGQPTEYFSSKPLEATAEQRFALKLRRATMAQLRKWGFRNAVHQSACRGAAARTKGDRTKAKFTSLATQHEKIADACYLEIARRNMKAASRGN